MRSHAGGRGERAKGHLVHAVVRRRAPVTGPVRVVIADDEPLIRAGLRAIFEGASGIEVVAVAATGEEAVAASRRHRPDVVLADIQMPRLDGLDAARQILAMTPAPKVIMRTTFDLDQYLYQAMRAGASLFLAIQPPPRPARGRDPDRRRRRRAAVLLDSPPPHRTIRPGRPRRARPVRGNPPFAVTMRNRRVAGPRPRD